MERRRSPLTPFSHRCHPAGDNEGKGVVTVKGTVDLLPGLGAAWLALIALTAAWAVRESIRRDPTPLLRTLRELLDKQSAALETAVARGDGKAVARARRELGELTRAWDSVRVRHLPDGHSRCGYCRSGWGRRRRWPCAASLAAAEALLLLGTCRDRQPPPAPNR
jgi:hypothetical protein